MLLKSLFASRLPLSHWPKQGRWRTLRKMRIREAGTKQATPAVNLPQQVRWGAGAAQGQGWLIQPQTLHQRSRDKGLQGTAPAGMKQAHQWALRSPEGLSTPRLQGLPAARCRTTGPLPGHRPRVARESVFSVTARYLCFSTESHFLLLKLGSKLKSLNSIQLVEKREEHLHRYVTEEVNQMIDKCTR